MIGEPLRPAAESISGAWITDLRRPGFARRNVSFQPPRAIDPGKVFDLELPLEQAAEGYRAMGERRAIKALIRP